MLQGLCVTVNKNDGIISGVALFVKEMWLLESRFVKGRLVAVKPSQGILLAETVVGRGKWTACATVDGLRRHFLDGSLPSFFLAQSYHADGHNQP